MSRRRHEQMARRGSVLVLFVILAMGFLAMAALVIDLGIVFTTRRQMQAAVNSAAIEGARNFSNDADGQTDAEQIKDLVFDHNLDTTTIEGGAGPSIAFSGGTVVDAGTFRAGRTMQYGSPPYYVPTLDYEKVGGLATARLARAAENAVPSLFRRGSIAGSQQFRDAVEAGYTVRAVSQASLRPALAVGVDVFGVSYSPSSTDLLPAGVAPLAVRLADWNGNTALTIVNVNSTGGLELMGGAAVGQVIRSARSTSDVSASNTSITIDAPGGGFPNVAPFRIRVDNELMRVTALSTSGSTATWTVERAIDFSTAAAHSTGASVSLAEPLSVGEALGDAARFNLGNFSVPNGLSLSAGNFLVPIYDALPATIGGTGQTVNVVIGFGYADISASTTPFTITRLTTAARRNASARLIRPLQLPTTDPGRTRTLRGFLENNYGAMSDEEFADLVNNRLFQAYRGTTPIASAVTAPASEKSP